MSRSSKNTFPDVADPRPEQTLKVVVFPARFGPMRAVILPVGTSSVTFLAATSPPNLTVTPCTRSPPVDADAIRRRSFDRFGCGGRALQLPAKGGVDPSSHRNWNASRRRHREVIAPIPKSRVR